jgi:hypothetical protein
MLAINDFIQKLVEDGYNPILILDIDDTCLSSRNGKRFVDKNVPILVNYVYDISPNNLWFLTARDYDYKNKTLHKLNKVGLLHKGKYINYNIIHSPYNELNNATKGISLLNNIVKNITHNDKNWYIIVDDDLEQINDIYDKISITEYNYSLYHFV